MIEPSLLGTDKTRTNRNRLEHGLRAAINTPIQGGAADIVVAAMVKVDKDPILKQMGFRLQL